MDQEFQFGELAEAQPQTGLRPDQNRHYTVVPVESPDETELPIYVDLDALRDMESHALSDTSVELGGVLLGSQYLDAGGKPFVVISDSLRARHYQATKGSFKFTHETWQQISREREEYPPDVQVVGWYHTHPDWGVFLSGMDLFICDHFFNRPQDVALVIDPCRGDRGFFEWTGDSAQRVRRTSGFFLIASRFRRAELEEYAAWLEGGNEMATDPRFSSASRGQYPPPVVVMPPAAPWQPIAVLGTLALQFGLLLLIAWRMVMPLPAGVGEAALPPPAAVSTGQDRGRELEAKLEVLDLVIAGMEGAPDALVTRLAERSGEVVALRDDLRAHRGLSARLETELSQLRAARDQTARQAAQLRDERDSLREAVDRLQHEQQRAAEEALAAERPWARWHWSWVAVAAVLGAVCGGGLVAGLHGRRSDAVASMLEEE